jgi:hypothetical protein
MQDPKDRTKPNSILISPTTQQQPTLATSLPTSSNTTPQKKGLPIMLPRTNQVLPIKPLQSPSRHWILTPFKKWSDLKINIKMKIRGEETSSHGPEKLYSSHKYIVEHSITGSILEEMSLVVGKIQVLMSTTEQEILKDGKPILSGVLDTALTKTTDSLEGKMRIQFTEVSYHFDKGSFILQISYYDPSNLNDPIIILKSPSFRVFARKPSIGHETLQPDKLKESGKKRKRDDSEKPKHSKLYNEFQKKLDILVQMKGNLSEEDKRVANESSLEKLLVIDPSYTVDLFLNKSTGETTKEDDETSRSQDPSEDL